MQPNDSIASKTETKSNRKLLYWFLIAILIALLPWLVLGFGA